MIKGHLGITHSYLRAPGRFLFPDLTYSFADHFQSVVGLLAPDFVEHDIYC